MESIRLKNETEDLLLSLTKHCKTLIKKTHTKLQNTLELKLMKPRETFSLKISFILRLGSKRTIRLTRLEVYNSLFFYNRRN